MASAPHSAGEMRIFLTDEPCHDLAATAVESLLTEEHFNHVSLTLKGNIVLRLLLQEQYHLGINEAWHEYTARTRGDQSICLKEPVPASNPPSDDANKDWIDTANRMARRRGYDQAMASFAEQMLAQIIDSIRRRIPRV